MSIGYIFSSIRSSARRFFMGLARSVKTRKTSRPLIISACILVFIWTYAVLWQLPARGAFAKQMDMYLSDFNIKIWVTAASILLLIMYFLMRRQKDNDADKGHDADWFEQKLNLQDQIFNQFFMESSVKIGKFDDVRKMPFYLVCGMTSAGSSTFITTSSTPLECVNAASVDKKYNISEDRQGLEVRYNKHMVVFEAPSKILEQDGKDEDALWDNIGDNLFNLRPQIPLNGVVLVLDVISLSNMPGKQRKRFALQLRRRLGSLNRQCGSGLPVYVVVTKLDLLNGFEGFISLLNEDALDNPFGFSFSIDPDNPYRWTKEIENNFTAFMERLNARVFESFSNNTSRMERERDYHFIRNFQGIKTILLRFMGEVLEENDFLYPPNVRGMYFISSAQKGIIANFHKLAVAKKYRLPLHPLSVGNHLRERTYFNKHFFTKVILQEPGVSGINQNFLQNRRATFFRNFFAAACLGALAIFAVHHAKATDSRRISDIRQQLSQKQWFSQPPYTGARMKYMNDDLNTMYKSLQAYPKYTSLFSLNNLTLHATELHNALKRNYEKALTHTFLRNIGETLAKNVTKPEYTENDRLETIRVFAMMQNKKYRDIPFTIKWAQNYWKQQATNSSLDVQNLNQHFDYSMHNLVADLSDLDPEFTGAKKQISQFSSAQRLYSTLKMLKKDSQPPVDLKKLVGEQFDLIFTTAGMEEDAFLISGLFTPMGYHALFGPDFRKNVKEAMVDEWVLQKDLSSYPEEKIEELKEQVARLYAVEYINTWRAKLANFIVRRADSLVEYSTILQALVAPEQPLQQIADAIRKNACFYANEGFIKTHKDDPDLPAVTSIADAFSDVNRLPERELAQQPMLVDLNAMVGSLKNDSNPGLGAFKIVDEKNTGEGKSVLSKLDSSAATVPMPFSNIFHQVADNGFSLIWRQALAYVNQVWADDICLVYKNEIAGKYPFNTRAGHSVNINDFSQFFSTQGELYRFAERFYPFIEQSRTFLKQHPGIATMQGNIEEKIDQLLNLGNALYSENGKFGLKLTITPIGLSSKFLRAVMNIDGQIINYAHEKPYPRTIIWPNTLRENVQSKLSMINRNGGGKTYSSNGTWSLFTLFSKAKYKKSSEDSFLLEYQTPSGSMVYSVNMEKGFNPFALSNFQIDLPQKIYRIQ